MFEKYKKDKIPRFSGHDTNNIKLTYDNDSDTNTGSTKYEQNTKGAHKDTDTENNVQNDRYNDTVIRVNGPQRQIKLTIDS